jgi:hypothetical protein
MVTRGNACATRGNALLIIACISILYFWIVRNELLLRKFYCSDNNYLILMLTRMVTRGNALLMFKFGAKTVAHAYTLLN